MLSDTMPDFTVVFRHLWATDYYRFLGHKTLPPLWPFIVAKSDEDGDD
jgi:hypothetical protein